MITRPVDSISPQLRVALHGNQLLPAVQSPAAPGDTVLLRNVRIVSITPAPAWAGGAPKETVTFEYGALTVTIPTGGSSLSKRQARH